MRIATADDTDSGRSTLNTGRTHNAHVCPRHLFMTGVLCFLHGVLCFLQTVNRPVETVNRVIDSRRPSGGPRLLTAYLRTD